MFGLRDLVVTTALLGCLSVLCNAVSVNRTKVEASIKTVYGEMTNTPRREEHPVSPDTTKEGKPYETVTKRFRLPLCVLPKKGSFICHAICVLLLNDNGTCQPGNICTCTIKESSETETLFGLFGK